MVTRARVSKTMLLLSFLVCAAQMACPTGVSALWNPFRAGVLPTAQEQFELAQSLEGKLRYARAMDAYQKVVDEFPSSPLAPEAQFRVAEMLEKTRNYYPAFNAYQAVLDKYPSYPKVNLILNRQFKIGNLFLQGKSVAFLRINPSGSANRAITIFRKIISNAPFSDIAPNAQYNLGVTYMQKKDYMEAAIEFEKISARYPQSDFVSQAKYQLGVCAYRQASAAPYDQEAAQDAINKLARFIDEFASDKNVESAKEMLSDLQSRKAGSLYQIGTFYEQRESPRAALIYLKEVMRDYPLTRYAEKARKTAIREEKKLELAESIRQAQDSVDEMERLIQSQSSAIKAIKGKGRSRWRFWRYVIPRKLSQEEGQKVSERQQKIRALRDRHAVAMLDLQESKALMRARLRVLRVEGEIQRIEDEMRTAQVDLQVAQSKRSGIGGIPETESAVMEAAEREIALKEESVKSKEAQIEKLRASVRGLADSAAAEEQQAKEYYTSKRELLSAGVEERGGEPAVQHDTSWLPFRRPASGEAKETEARAPEKKRAWWWPFHKGEGRAGGEVKDQCEAIYKDAVAMVDQAERKRLERKWEEALSNYDRASLKLMELMKLWPGFRGREISRNLRTCREGIQDVREESAKQQYAELLADLEERLRKDPYDVETHFSLAEVYREYGEEDKAIDAYEKAIALRPDYAAAYYGLGVACMSKGDMEKASLNLRKAVEIAPHNAQAHDRLGIARRELGDYAGAGREFEAAIEADPSYPAPYFSLGQLYQSALGDRKKAALYWEKYLRLAPDDPQAPMIMEWVQQERAAERSAGVR